MKKTKKLLAVLLAMALALGLLPAAAMAACDPKVTITSITRPRATCTSGRAAIRWASALRSAAIREQRSKPGKR